MGRSFLQPGKEPKEAVFVAAPAAGFSANRGLRGPSFLEPRKEAKEAALSSLLLLVFPLTGIDADCRSRTRPASLATRCAKRTAEHRKKPAKPSKLGFAGFFLCSGCPGTRLATVTKLAEASLFAHSTWFAGCFFAAFFSEESAYPISLRVADSDQLSARYCTKAVRLPVR